ncbi:MAG: hypothetical protein Q8O40_09510 [Chloroflexota bacterium]|nr:hypothetical protein [Chloroflexota bacterium]
MAEVSLGILTADIFERPPHGQAGPVRAKGEVKILGQGAPAFVVAALLPRDGDAPLAVGFGFTDATGYYNVPIEIASLNLPLGSYRVREVIFSLGPPVIQDVAVEIAPTVISTRVLGAGVSEGSVLAEILYMNTSVALVDYAFVEVALIQEPVDAAKSTPVQPQTLYVNRPTFALPPGIPLAMLPPTPFWGDAPVGFVRGYKMLRPAEGTPGTAIQPFDPLDTRLVARMGSIVALEDQRRAGTLSSEEFYARLTALAREDPTDFLHITVPPLQIDPVPDAPTGIYHGFNFIAEHVTYGSDSLRTPPEDELWGWIAPAIYLNVWRKIPPVVAASILAARWWTE